ncbi:hypothetical protein BLOT_002746 [Blomia tropicalis]|nr:hypothetical protein BLOT_002746 [Blomia tropicalis]
MAFLPIRVIISILGVYACALVYTQRSAMSVAIVAMTTVDSKGNDNTTNNNQKPEFDWNEKLQGVILGSQFYLYIIVPTIAGRITDTFGAKWVNFSGAAVPCVLSLLTPIGVRYGGVGTLIAIRVIDGAFHGCVYASLFSLYTRWFPPNERVNANGSLFFGGSLGSTVMFALAGWACETSVGWPMVYYINAVLYIPWMILWIYYCSNDPASNARITQEELQFIQNNIEHTTVVGENKKKRSTPWIHIFTSIPVLSSMFLKMCSGFGYFLLITKMPSFFYNVLGIAIFKNGLFSASTTLCQGLCALLAAPLSNWIIKRFNLPVLIVRKVFQSIAAFGPCICLALIPSMEDHATVVIALLLLAMIAYGFFTGGEWSTGSEYAPNSAGVVFGFSNSLAFLMGVVAPFLVGILLDAENSDNRHQWNMIMYITAAIYAVGPLPFFIFGTTKQQWWDKLVEFDENQHLDKY